MAYLDAQRAKGERRRLVKAYREGVLTLDDLAADKTDIERTIAQYTKANEELCADVDGKVPSEVEFENIEEYAAELVMGAEKGLENLKGQHKLYQKLHLRGVLCYEDGEFFMDVSCILGRQRLSTSSNLPSRVRKGGSYAATGVPKLFYMDGEGGQQQEIAD